VVKIETMKNINNQNALICLPLAVIYGALYWGLLENIQPAIVNQIYNCSYCERCANILYDREQVVLALCAALAGAAVGLLRFKGFGGVFKTIFVTYLAFQVYSVWTIRSVIFAHECTALHRERIFPVVALVILVINMLLTSAVWAGICAAPLVLFNLVRTLVFTEKDEVQKLDLGLR
jgi:hypothetical protein